MKNLLLLLLFPAFSYAQDWAPTGAKWTFSQKTINPNLITYSTLESRKETFKLGKKCHYIEELNRHNYSSADTVKHYMYSEKNKVYFLKDSLWCLLYDFNAQAGDTFVIGCTPSYKGGLVKVIVQSVETKNIYGKSRKVFSYLTNEIVYDFSGTVIEGIGHTSKMLPGTYDTRLMGPLRCYEESGISLYKVEAFKEDCNLIITGNEDQINSVNFKMYPNPITNSMLHLEFQAEDNQFEIIDMLGKVLIKKTCSIHCAVDLSDIPNGPYILKIINEQQGNSSQWIVKNN